MTNKSEINLHRLRSKLSSLKPRVEDFNIDNKVTVKKFVLTNDTYPSCFIRVQRFLSNKLGM